MASAPSLETLASLSTRWELLWSPAELGSRESYSFGDGVLLEFDRLPTLHRHAEQAVEYAEIVFRATTILRALVQSAEGECVFVSTFSWSDGPGPVARDAWVERFLPASLWRSAITDSWEPDPDATDELPVHEHTWVTQLDLNDPALAAALTLAANGEDLAIYPADASWVFTSMEDGAHVRTDGDRAASLVAQFPGWVGRATRQQSTKVRLEDERGWQIDFSFLDERTAGRILDLAESNGLLSGHVHGRLVDPREEHVVSLSREDAQRLRILIIGEPDVVVDDLTGSSREMTPEMLREEMEDDSEPLGDLDDFLSEGYRHPGEAEDGRLPRRLWNPRFNYGDIDGS